MFKTTGTFADILYCNKRALSLSNVVCSFLDRFDKNKPNIVRLLKLRIVIFETYSGILQGQGILEGPIGIFIF